MGKPPAILANVSNRLLGPLAVGFAITVLTACIVLPVPPTPSIIDSLSWGGPTMGVLLLGPCRVTGSLEILREELCRTTEEQRAFEQFATNVNQLTPESPQLDSTATVPTTLTYREKPPSPNIALKSVCQIYRETVMDADHYEEDYGDSLPESVIAEFGVDLAIALLNADVFTESLQKTLVNAGFEAANDRETFQTTLTHEIEELTTAQPALRELTTRIKQIGNDVVNPTSFETLIQSHEHMQQVEAEAEALLQERQTTVAGYPQPDGMPLLLYLHRDQDWTYPVLADTLDLLSEISDLNRQIIHTLSRPE